MYLDFDRPMNLYEFIAITISIVALLFQIIPKIYYYSFKKTRLIFIPNGDIKLLFNHSGAYLRLYGVFESKNRQSIIRNIIVKIRRISDNNIYTFVWSAFISPLRQNFSNNSYTESIEIAHPILIAKDSLFPAFIEYSDDTSSSSTIISSCLEPLHNKISLLFNEHNNYNDAHIDYVSSKDYMRSQSVISSEFIWKSGKYDLELEVAYNYNKKSFYYEFNISEYEYKKLNNNIEESIICDLKKRYMVGLNFYIANIHIHEKK